MRFCLAAAFLALQLIRPAYAEPRELVLVHSGASGSIYEISANEFARRVNERLPELSRVMVIADPAMGDGPALVDTVRSGAAVFALPSSGMISVSDAFAIFELPFLIRERAQIGRIRASLLERYLQPEAARKGLRILAVWENGFRHFTNDARRIRHPRDLRGLKLAVSPNPWREKVLRAFGADPVPIAARAVKDALRTRIADGHEAPLAGISALHLSEVQRHLSLSDHLYSPAFLIASEAQLASLPPAVRAIIASEAVAMEGWIANLAIDVESDLVDQLDREMELSHIDRAAFKAASRAVYGDFVRTVPGGARMIEIMSESGDAATGSATE